MKRAILWRRSLLLLIVPGWIGAFAGCGGGSQPAPPHFSGNTSVTMMLSSSANDQLSQFNLTFKGINLTDQAGNTVPLLSTAQGAEFIHLNGQVEQLVTVSVSQGIYTSATAMIGGAQFTCNALSSSGGVATNIYAYGAVPEGNVTVNLPSPLTVAGDSMTLLVKMLVSPSATFPSCDQESGIPIYSINPTFSITPISFSSSPSNQGNGKVRSLQGQITAMDTNGESFTLSVPEPSVSSRRTQAISATSNTVYQGISGFSSLAVDTLVDMDGTVQPDGSLVATRIAVLDPAAVDIMSGPVLGVFPAEPAIQEPSAVFFARLSQGRDQIPDTWSYGISNAIFQISGEVNNLAALPFPATFNVSNMVAGQNVYVSSLNMTYTGGIYTSANTITLLPQTINGMVTSTSQSGNFSVYSVSLAPYDLFPQLAVQQGQATLLTNPSEIEVYVDNNTQLLNTQSLAAGNTLRFYGLVFNDSGTLRMDCVQVSDGVTQSSQSSGAQASQLRGGQVHQTEQPGPAGHSQAVRVITSQPQL